MDFEIFRNLKILRFLEISKFFDFSNFKNVFFLHNKNYFSSKVFNDLNCLQNLRKLSVALFQTTRYHSASDSWYFRTKICSESTISGYRVYGTLCPHTQPLPSGRGWGQNFFGGDVPDLQTVVSPSSGGVVGSTAA